MFASVLGVSLPASAGAQCTSWDASGNLTILQRGSNDNIGLTLEQKGMVITGTAGYDARNDTHGGFGRKHVQGNVDGAINGDSFSVQIFWPDNLTGVYNAKILPSGRLDGETYDKNNSKIRQTWRSEGVLKCAPPPINPRVVVQSTSKKPPPPIKSTGKMPKSEPAAPKLEPPYIVASQAKPQHLGASTGFAVLTWDGGPDHPFAEVWVKVNGGDETFVVEKGKDSRQVIAELGKTYLYILTDAGKTLATVGVVLVPR